jgi:Tol biopolymer transport system component
VPASGGTPTALTTLDGSRGEASHSFPQMLTGDRFIYWASGSTLNTTGIYASSLSRPGDRAFLMATEGKALYASGNGGHYLLWARAGSLLAQDFDPESLKLSGEPRAVADRVGNAGITGETNATASTNGVLLMSATNVLSQFAWFDRAGKALGAVGQPGDYHSFRLSADGRRLATSRLRPGGADLWLLDLDRGGVATRFTSRPGYTFFPIWSPDSQTMVSGSSPPNVFAKPVSGTGAERRLTQSTNQQVPLDWSLDGTWILVMDIVPGTGRDLAFLAMAPEPGKLLSYIRTPFNETWGRFSPGGNPRFVAYQSDESGRYEVYVNSFPVPRARTQISTAGGQFPAWRSDGRELFYVSPEFRLMAVDLSINADSVQPSAPRELFQLPAVDTGRSPYEITADGQRVLVRATPRAAASQSLTMIVNWPILLKR